MSINPLIGNDGLPLLVIGEVLLLKRSNIRLITKIGNFNVQSDGVMFISTLRITFIADKPNERFKALDIPLMSIRKEKFNQPIFGCNNLSITVVPQNQWGEGKQFDAKFEFRSGGAQTFLRLFFKVMSGVNEVRNIPIAQTVPDDVRNIASGDFVNMAFVDPTDPSFVYTSQPYVPSSYLPQNYPVPMYYVPPQQTIQPTYVDINSQPSVVYNDIPQAQPSYQPSQPSYQPSQPAYQPSQPSYQPSQPAYQPSQPAYQPSQPSYQPSQQTYPPPSQQTYQISPPNQSPYSYPPQVPPPYTQQQQYVTILPDEPGNAQYHGR